MDGTTPRSLGEQILFLEGGELRRLLPFFLLYLLLFMGLTVADGLSLSLFVQKVGAAQLPACYSVTAVLNLFGIVAYLWSLQRISRVRVFQAILTGNALLYLLVWGGDRYWETGTDWYVLLFVGRELAYTLVLMHFGTYLLDYFQPGQLHRVLPIVYAGGRVGGILGGFALQQWPRYLPVIDLILLFVGLFLLGSLMLQWLKSAEPVETKANSVPGAASSASATAADSASSVSSLEQNASHSLGGFLQFVWHHKPLFWMTLISLMFVACRWVLNFQYSTIFERSFTDAAEMTQFLGTYTQAALLFSLLFQLLVVNRLIARIGLRGTHAVYAGLMLTAFAGNLVSSTFWLAVFSRFVETELRFGLRNPINQMMLNQFSKAVRVQVRAWSLGFLIPVATLTTAGLLQQVPHWGGPYAIGWLGILSGMGYWLTSSWYFDSTKTPGRAEIVVIPREEAEERTSTEKKPVKPINHEFNPQITELATRESKHTDD